MRKRTLKSGRKKEKKSKADPKCRPHSLPLRNQIVLLTTISAPQCTTASEHASTISSVSSSSSACKSLLLPGSGTYRQISRRVTFPQNAAAPTICAVLWPALIVPHQTVCREIWALNLSLLPTPPVPEPLLHLQDTLGENRASRASQKLGADADEPLHAANEGDTEEDHSDSHQSDEDKRKGDASSSSSSGSDEDDSERDEELEELMRENSETPSSDEDEVDDDSERKRKATDTSTRKKRRTFGEYDTLTSTVAVLTVACWTLRLPLMYVDLTRYIELDHVRLSVLMVFQACREL